MPAGGHHADDDNTGASSAEPSRLGTRASRVGAATIAVGLILTAVIVQTAIAAQRADRRDALTARSEQLRLAIDDKLNALQASVVEQRNALALNWPFDRRDFHDLAELADASGPRDGVAATTFVRAVEGDDVDEFVARVRADRSLDPGGYPDFTVTPEASAQDLRFIVEYVEPFAGNERAFGFDVSSEEHRRLAIETARDRGEAVATEPVRLVQDAGGVDLRPAILLVAPVYDSGDLPPTGPARRRHFAGVLATPVRIADLLDDVVRSTSELSFEIYDIGPTDDPPASAAAADGLVFDSAGGTTLRPGSPIEVLHQFRDIDVGGRRWRIAATPTEAMSAGSQPLPLYAGLAGVVLVAAVAAVVLTVSSARARAEQLVERRTAELRRLIENAPDATVVVDDDGRIVLASAMVRPLLGYVPDELIGQPVEVLVAEGTRERHAALRVHNPNTFRRMGGDRELTARHKDGSVVPVEISLSPLLEDHDLGRIIASIRDVTVQRRAREALEQANEQRAKFLGTVSHELRTPLTAIRGFTRLLIDRRDSLPEEMQAEFLERIDRNGESLGVLIEELLEYTRLDRGGLELHRSVVKLDTLVAQTLDQLSTVTADHVVDRQLAATSAWADTRAVSRIVTNLITNAARYTPVDTTITVMTRNRTDGCAELVVDDEGPGIPVAERPRVFERFWRGELANQQAIGGTGIGLAIVAELAALGEGTVTVEDSPSGGARFLVTFPSAPGARSRPTAEPSRPGRSEREDSTA